MNEFKITVTDDKKEKDQSFEATAEFDYVWNNSWNGYGGQFSMTAFGKTEIEAKTKLVEELFTFQTALVKALSKV